MNTPPFLMLVTLLFWGWRTGLLFHGVVAGGLLEASRFVPLRLDFSEKELKRMWDLCVLLLIGALAYTYFSEDANNPTFLSIQWLPLLFLPMMLAQAFGHQEKIPASTFSLIKLKRPRAAYESEITAINISYVYFVVCLLAAGANNGRRLDYFVGLCLLTGWALWRHRARRFSAATWGILLVLVLGLTYVSARELSRLQALLEGRITEWVTGFVRQDTDPLDSRTAIGEILRLKLSGRIVLRVESEGSPPDLLSEATYDRFQGTTWHASRKEFNELGTPTEEGYWKLIPNKTFRKVVTIASYLDGGSGTIALPMGTAEIDHLPATALRTNALGTVLAEEGPGLVRYSARYGPGALLEGPISADDLQVPVAESNAVTTIATRLQLAGLPAHEVARRLKSFFQEHFTYTLNLGSRHQYHYDRLSPVSRFLLKTRAGHCEYFATATALLLREVRIPARYVVGYSVQESDGPHRYLVRERHAHAWVVYYDRQTRSWSELDTTPAGWGQQEASRASWWEPFGDFFSDLWFQFSTWRWLTDRTTLQRYVFGLLIPLVGILMYRLLTAKRRHRTIISRKETAEDGCRLGVDSEFYLVERKLAEKGLVREAGEPFTEWMTRMRQESALEDSSSLLQPILDLHYRYRFDPVGLSQPERLQLRGLVQTWLGNFSGTPSMVRERD